MKCLVCNATPFLWTKVVKRYGDKKVQYDIWKCPMCQFGRADGLVGDELLSEIYSGSFFSSAQQSADMTIESILEGNGLQYPILANGVQRVKKIMKYKAEGGLLDIGAGKGFFVAQASKFFNASGLEYSMDAVLHGQRMGIRIEQGDFLHSNLDQGSFDVITMWDVLSSLKDPMEGLRKCSSLLKPGGILVFTVPVFDSLVPRILKRKWPLLIPPINLNYFSDKSIDLSLSSVNLDLIESKFEGKMVALDFLIQKLISTFFITPMKRRKIKHLNKINLKINTFDIRCIVASKRVDNYTGNPSCFDASKKLESEANDKLLYMPKK